MDYFLGFGVALLVTVVAGTALYFIMTYGTKEKSYEEAILEQRQRSEDALLLGKSAKDKQKEKKMKKAGKKVKEKSQKPAAVKEVSDNISSEETDQGTQNAPKNQHVGFVQPEAAVIEETSAVSEKDDTTDRNIKKTSQKQGDSDKALTTVKKEKDIGVTKTEKPQPKNEKTEKQASSKAGKQTSVKSEKSLSSVPSKEQPVKEVAEPEKHEKNGKAEKQEKPTAPKVEKPVTEEAVIAVSTVPVQASSSKSNKNKKKNEITLEQMSMGRDAITCSVIEPLLLNSELSRSEIQNLIDLLLNKQQGSEAEHAEWIEGRQDPMMKLKKAFAEKEKALQEEQEASLAVQNKLREVRAEANAERSRLLQTVRQLEEKLAARTAELSASSSKIQHEKQALTQQIQQLKHQMEQEHLVLRKMQEEQSAAQAAVQARQQLEHHVAALSAQHQEQVEQLVKQCELLSAQVAQLQEQLKNAQNASQGEVHAKLKQLSDMKAAKEDVERQLTVARQRENQLSNELSKLKDVASQRQADLDKTTADVAHLKEENERLSTQVSLVSQLQTENRQLRDEIESLAAQVTAVTERPAAEGRENGDLTEEKHADAKLMSAQLIHEEALREKEIQIEKLAEQVQQAEKSASSTIDSLRSEISKHKSHVVQLTNDLEQQKKKNDELRNKNYKAMDCVAASEKLVQSKMQESEKLVHETQKSVQLQEEKNTRELLQRLFPSINIEEKVHAEWVKKFSTAVSNYISELNNRQSPPQTTVTEDQSALLVDLEKRNSQLSNMVTNYKTIIEDTEGMLNKLQQHVEAEETKWRQQLAAIKADLEGVKRERDELKSQSPAEPNSQLQDKLESLQEKLSCAEAERDRLQSELVANDKARASIDQLIEERDRLSADLAIQQSKSSELSMDITKFKELLEVSQDSLAKEKSNSELLREEIEKLKENCFPASLGSPAPISQTVNGAMNGPVSSEAAVTELPMVIPAPAPPLKLLNSHQMSKSDTSDKSKRKKKKKAASTKKKNLSGWLKKKVGGSKSPNLSARGDEFLTAERMDSSS